jgi:glycosyltransferase involved in cell wall biosynthesis
MTNSVRLWCSGAASVIDVHFASPSTTEGFGLPPMEGLAVGCPAVLAPCGALPEVAGEAALYASAKNQQECAQAIRRFADVPTVRSAYSAAGISRAMNFTLPGSEPALFSFEVIQAAAKAD